MVKTRLDQRAAVYTLRNAGNVTVNCIMLDHNDSQRAARPAVAGP